jgi:hypothetical protein
MRNITRLPRSPSTAWIAGVTILNLAPGLEAREAVAAAPLKEKAVREVTGTEREIERARVAARGSQVIDYAAPHLCGAEDDRLAGLRTPRLTGPPRSCSIRMVSL